MSKKHEQFDINFSSCVTNQRSMYITQELKKKEEMKTSHTALQPTSST